MLRMFHGRRWLPAALVSILVVMSLFAAACGDDDDDPTATPEPATPTTQAGGESPTPATPSGGESPSPAPTDPTTTPTPEVEDPQGFEEALRDFEAQLRSGGLDAITARLLVQDYICKESDLGQGLGGAECATVGEAIRAVELSAWRSSGGLRKVESVVAFLQQLNGDLVADASDDWGDGDFDVYAFDSSVNRAVITFMVECQENFQCENDTQRVAMVLSFDYDDDRWMVSRIMSAFVLYEDFLEPTEEGKSFYFPEWEQLN